MFRSNDITTLASNEHGYWYNYLSLVDKQHTKFVVSLPLNMALGTTVCSNSAAPMGRGFREQGSHTEASSSVGDRSMR